MVFDVKNFAFLGVGLLASFSWLGGFLYGQGGVDRIYGSLTVLLSWMDSGSSLENFWHNYSQSKILSIVWLRIIRISFSLLIPQPPYLLSLRRNIVFLPFLLLLYLKSTPPLTPLPIKIKPPLKWQQTILTTVRRIISFRTDPTISSLENNIYVYVESTPSKASYLEWRPLLNNA
jgi:hypothetical protein